MLWMHPLGTRILTDKPAYTPCISVFGLQMVQTIHTTADRRGHFDRRKKPRKWSSQTWWEKWVVLTTQLICFQQKQNWIFVRLTVIFFADIWWDRNSLSMCSMMVFSSVQLWYVTTCKKRKQYAAATYVSNKNIISGVLILSVWNMYKNIKVILVYSIAAVPIIHHASLNSILTR